MGKGKDQCGRDAGGPGRRGRCRCPAGSGTVQFAGLACFFGRELMTEDGEQIDDDDAISTDDRALSWPRSGAASSRVHIRG
jgi:hypothetical protein